MIRKKSLALKPWEPFFWYGGLPAGICVKSEGKRALLPSGHEIAGPIYYAVCFRPHTEKRFISFHLYVFQIDPVRHPERSVRREGYWHVYLGEAWAAPGSIDILRCIMDSLQKLAFTQGVLDYPDDALIDLIAWDERMGSADRDI